jgi:hypothetical protein
MTRLALLIPLVLAAACAEDGPREPTAEQSYELNEAEKLLNETADEHSP